MIGLPVVDPLTFCPGLLATHSPWRLDATYCVAVLCATYTVAASHSHVTLIIFLTELTSNIGTTATFLPVVGAIAIEAGYDPIVLLVPVTLAASCAFMLPVATPPNAIVFGSGMLTIPKMARAGLVLNLISIVLVSVVALALTPKIL